MSNEPSIQEVLAIVRKEHQRTQVVFGISIIVLCIVMIGIVYVLTKSGYLQRTFLINEESSITAENYIQEETSEATTTTP